jgi:hypothetical protein
LQWRISPGIRVEFFLLIIITPASVQVRAQWRATFATSGALTCPVGERWRYLSTNFSVRADAEAVGRSSAARPPAVPETAFGTGRT